MQPIKFEVYVTDEESYTPYVSPLNSTPLYYKSGVKGKSGGKNKDQEISSQASGISLCKGPITKTISFPNIITASYSNDYDNLSGEMKVTLTYKKEFLLLLKKGQRCCLHVGEDVHILCFIIDIQFKSHQIELTCNTYAKVIEQQWSCTYTQQRRSVILTEICKEAGLKPVIDIDDLQDDIITYTSITDETGGAGKPSLGDDCTDTGKMAAKTGGHHGNTGTGENFNEACKKGYATEGHSYYKWARSFKTDKDMLLRLRSLFNYEKYWNNRTCPDALFNDQGFTCNCYDAARLVKVCMDARGGNCVVVTGSIYEGGHAWNCINIDDGWKSFDLVYQVSSRGDIGGTNESNIW